MSANFKLNNPAFLILYIVCPPWGGANDMEATVKDIGTVKIPTPAISDNGNVRMGFASPAFPPVHAAPVNVIDSGRVRTGFATPAFPPVRAR